MPEGCWVGEMGPSKLNLSLEPVDAASTSGRLGPFAMYFPSGFQPGKHADCKWEVQTDKVKPQQHYVIGRTVSSLPSSEGPKQVIFYKQER